MVHINSPITDAPRPILEWIYEFYTETAPCDNEQVLEDFNRLYSAINSLDPIDVSSIITPVHVLCRDQEQRIFVNGIRVGVQLAIDLHLSGTVP